MISRKFAATVPFFLIAGIIAQVVILVLVIVMYIPILIWPSLLDQPVKKVYRGFTRTFFRRRKPAENSERVAL